VEINFGGKIITVKLIIVARRLISQKGEGVGASPAAFLPPRGASPQLYDLRHHRVIAYSYLQEEEAEQ
jgi:hypothetical protein